jgi:hypothetical protein
MSLKRVSVAIDEAGDWLAAQGFTDGLPVVAPTPERLAAMLAGTAREPSEMLGEVPPRHVALTIEKVAVCAVLAGCPPHALPVVIGACEAMLVPEFRLNSIQSTTSPAAPFFVVDGPAADAAGMVSGTGCFGPGIGTNATIGRAVRLVLMVVGGGVPGDGDPATHGMPAKLTACIAERPDSPWPLLGQRRGFPDSSISVFAITGTWQVSEPATTVDDIVHQVLHGMINLGHCSQPRLPQSAQQLLLLSPGIAAALAVRFRRIEQLQQALHDTLRVPLGWVPPYKRDASLARCAELGLDTSDGQVPLSESPETFFVVVAGGDAGVQSFGMSTLTLSRSTAVAL